MSVRATGRLPVRFVTNWTRLPTLVTIDQWNISLCGVGAVG